MSPYGGMSSELDNGGGDEEREMGEQHHTSVEVGSTLQAKHLVRLN